MGNRQVGSGLDSLCWLLMVFYVDGGKRASAKTSL